MNISVREDLVCSVAIVTDSDSEQTRSLKPKLKQSKLDDKLSLDYKLSRFYEVLWEKNKVRNGFILSILFQLVKSKYFKGFMFQIM